MDNNQMQGGGPGRPQGPGGQKQPDNGRNKNNGKKQGGGKKHSGFSGDYFDCDACHEYRYQYGKRYNRA